MSAYLHSLSPYSGFDFRTSGDVMLLMTERLKNYAAIYNEHTPGGFIIDAHLDPSQGSVALSTPFATMFMLDDNNHVVIDLELVSDGENDSDYMTLADLQLAEDGKPSLNGKEIEPDSFELLCLDLFTVFLEDSLAAVRRTH